MFTPFISFSIISPLHVHHLFHHPANSKIHKSFPSSRYISQPQTHLNQYLKDKEALTRQLGLGQFRWRGKLVPVLFGGKKNVQENGKASEWEARAEKEVKCGLG